MRRGIPNLEGFVKSQTSDDKVKSFRCKARKYEGMRRTYVYAGLAALPELGQGAQPGNDRGCSATQQIDFLRSRQD